MKWGIRRSVQVTLAAAVLAWVCTAQRAIADEPARGPSIYWIDSEGGGSTLIVTPDGESVLLDTGNPSAPGSKRESDGARINRVAREVAHLSKIDHVVLSHFHFDHYGGLAELATLIPIQHLYDKGIPDSNPDGVDPNHTWASEIRPYREAKVGERVMIKPGDLIPLKSTSGMRMQLRFLGANGRFIPPPAGTPVNPLLSSAPKETWKDPYENGNSVVTLFEYGPFRYFFGGDLTLMPERDLVLPYNLVGKVDVYQVDHHGLDESNNPLLIRSLSPSVSVMNNAPRKGTSPFVLRTLSDSGVVQYQLHENVREGAGETNAANERIANHGDLGDGCKANYIQCAVSADGRGYVMSVPATGHTQAFKTRAE